MRTLALLGCFVAGSGAGAWLGYAVAIVSGITSADPPRFPGGSLAASALAIGMLALLSVAAQRAGGGGEPLARACARGRSARNSLLFAAAFSAFAVEYAVYALGRVSLLAVCAAALVTFLLALAAIRRSALLRVAGVSLGSLYALAGVAVSLARAF